MDVNGEWDCEDGRKHMQVQPETILMACGLALAIKSYFLAVRSARDEEKLYASPLRP